MRLLARIATALALAATLVCLLPGCSGTGAPVDTGDLARLRAVADSHLSSVLFVKRWMAALHPPAESAGGERPSRRCEPRHDQVPPLPDDPPGTQRWFHVLADCTTVDHVELPDGWATFVFHYPDGREKTQRSGPVQTDGDWRRQDIQILFWDGTELAFVFSFAPRLPSHPQEWAGAATLSDARDYGFTLRRNDVRDELATTPYDGSALALSVPLDPHTFWQPSYEEPASGTYATPSGVEHSFRIASLSGERWDTWELVADDDIAAAFTLDSSLAGTGKLTRGRKLLGVLTWDRDGKGHLQPVGASAVDVAPSSAARAFRIDQWIRNVSDLGPSPVY